MLHRHVARLTAVCLALITFAAASPATGIAGEAAAPLVFTVPVEGTPAAASADAEYGCHGIAPLETTCTETFTVACCTVQLGLGPSIPFVGRIGATVETATATFAVSCMVTTALVVEDCEVETRGAFRAGQEATLTGWASEDALGDWGVRVTN